MTEPAQLLPHRPTAPPIDLAHDPSVGQPHAEPARPALSRPQQLALAAQVHQVVSQLLAACSAIEAIPDEIWDDPSLERVGEDLRDTTHAAALSARGAYEKALAVEVVLAQAMR